MFLSFHVQNFSRAPQHGLFLGRDSLRRCSDISPARQPVRQAFRRIPTSTGNLPESAAAYACATHPVFSGMPLQKRRCEVTFQWPFSFADTRNGTLLWGAVPLSPSCKRIGNFFLPPPGSLRPAFIKWYQGTNETQYGRKLPSYQVEKSSSFCRIRFYPTKSL